MPLGFCLFAVQSVLDKFTIGVYFQMLYGVFHVTVDRIQCAE